MGLRTARRAALLGAVCAIAAAVAQPAAAAPRVGWSVAWGRSPVILFEGYGGGIYAVSPQGGGVRRITRAGGAGMSLSPDGRTIVLSDDCTLYRIDVSGRGLRKLGRGCAPAWAPDGRRIAFTDGGLEVMDADGKHPRTIVRNPYSVFAPLATWSPDGRKLAYVACSAPEGTRPCEHQYGLDVYVIGLDGSERHKVTPKPSFPQCPAWSRRALLAFLATDGTVAVVQKGGGVRTFRPAGCPAWAPNGRRFAVPTATGVALMNADGRGRRQITILPGSASKFSGIAWSADGTRLAVIGQNRLWVVGADGSQLKRLA